MPIHDDDRADLKLSAEVGRRLRVIRRERRWSLEDVERESGGRWSASAIGAYERGYRNLSLPRLQELAHFYSVTMAELLGEDARTELSASKLVLDLAALERAEEAREIATYARSILRERGDYAAAVLSIRRDDVRALCSLTQLAEVELVEQLRSWGVLAER